ncbi:hypothetical protein [Pseudonocardia spinosispora]|uniref:hypothetical protein n=1 Tax=Pseudonocardia spinosispora TaxID=103441 RepID=UPI0003FDBA1A|nr:hypothetical protein [Pseudonocardia spinosispora]
MADQDPNWTDTTETSTDTVTETKRRRQGPDLLPLLAGLVTLAMACMALANWVPNFPSLDPRWLLAGGAVLVGVLLLIASVRPPRR